MWNRGDISGTDWISDGVKYIEHLTVQQTIQFQEKSEKWMYEGYASIQKYSSIQIMEILSPSWFQLSPCSRLHDTISTFWNLVSPPTVSSCSQQNDGCSMISSDENGNPFFKLVPWHQSPSAKCNWHNQIHHLWSSMPIHPQHWCLGNWKSRLTSSIDSEIDGSNNCTNNIHACWFESQQTWPCVR